MKQQLLEGGRVVKKGEMFVDWKEARTAEVIDVAEETVFLEWCNLDRSEKIVEAYEKADIRKAIKNHSLQRQF